MKLPARIFLFIILTISMASCDKLPFGNGAPRDPTWTVTNWSINLKYTDPATKEPLIGENRYFSPYHIQIWKKNDTGYAATFYYNMYGEPDSQRDDSYTIILGHSVTTEVTKENYNTNISGPIAIAERFDEEYIVQLKHAKADIRDTFRLLKDTESNFHIYLNGQLMISPPSPTKPGKAMQLTLER
ncbi:MAG: hypothetical protein KDC07_06615 [Chitinophagaceae bacterium]|nr:hypothetical protein [Chitinophagaceae bacterium]MCB9047199.1 hypothetical protein [Chitinophagales bacterium]